MEFKNGNYITSVKDFKNNIYAKPIKVLFLVSETAKWKAQSLYDLLDRSEEFEPVIAITLADFQPKLSEENRKKIISDTLDYFKSKSMNCVIAYDAINMDFLFHFLGKDLWSLFNDDVTICDMTLSIHLHVLNGEDQSLYFTELRKP